MRCVDTHAQVLEISCVSSKFDGAPETIDENSLHRAVISALAQTITSYNYRNRRRNELLYDR